MTEKEIEGCLESEVRVLDLPSGERRPVRAFRLVWEVFDLIPQTGVYTPEQLIDYAADHAEETGVDFGEALAKVCGYAQRRLRGL